jgi:hypothetical protein
MLKIFDVVVDVRVDVVVDTFQLRVRLAEVGVDGLVGYGSDVELLRLGNLRGGLIAFASGDQDEERQKTLRRLLESHWIVLVSGVFC